MLDNIIKTSLFGILCNKNKEVILYGQTPYHGKLNHICNEKQRDTEAEEALKFMWRRVPHTSEAVGCGYGVYVPQRTEEAQQILQRSGIRILGRMERADLR